MRVSEMHLFCSPSPKREASNGFQPRLHWGRGAEVSIQIPRMLPGGQRLRQKAKNRKQTVGRYEEILEGLNMKHEDPESNAKAARALESFSVILASQQQILSPPLKLPGEDCRERHVTAWPWGVGFLNQSQRAHR